MKSLLQARRTASWGAFALALITYLLTLEWGASYWDCPEYIVTAWRLEPGHPPGNPLWSLTARIFTIIAGSPERTAIAVNASSALFMAGGAGLLASCIFFILRATIMRSRTRLGAWATALFSLAGALCFAWADSPWFSAVEAEVYAMSLFLTALTVRLAIGWALMRDRVAARRQLLLIVYITGLSIGVHQLNLLAIPAVALIWFYRRHPARAPWLTLLTIVMSFAAIALILFGMMPGVIRLCEIMELFCVNTLGLPMHSGVWTAWALLLIVSAGIPYAIRAWFIRRKPGRGRGTFRLRSDILTVAWIPFIILTGYSVYMILLVRGAANPPMNEASPSNIFSLSAYLGRDQYGSSPLFYGRTPYSTPLREEMIGSDGNATYPRFARKNKGALYAEAYDSTTGRPAGHYVRYGDKTEILYPPELNMLLPRMQSSNPDDIDSYGDWGGMRPEKMNMVEASYAVDSTGRAVGKLLADGSRVKSKTLRPTYLQQLQYLGAYQVSYMYLRYLMWNFSGRQNDRFAVGEVEHGNFITGFPAIDNAMLGPQDRMPAEIGRDNRGHNVYYMIPLLLGIAGILALCDTKRRSCSRWNFIIFVLFFMTGIAIVLYLNQNPREPRERDYSFLGSFWAYAVWIACGMAWIFRAASHSRPKWLRVSLQAGAAALAVFTPCLMLTQNYDDHNRSGRTAVDDFAANMLNSLEPDAILFVNGDNYTFPLWYAQEVRGIRRDVSVINLAYLNTPWYAIQLQRPGEVSRPIVMQAPPEKIAFGKFAYVYYKRRDLQQTVDPSLDNAPEAVPAVEALRKLYADPAEHPSLDATLSLQGIDGERIVVNADEIAGGAGHISAQKLIMFDIIASNAASKRPRPVYWSDALSPDNFSGLHPYTTADLQTRRLRLSTTPAPGETPRELKMLSGGADRSNFYADVTVGEMISRQRMSLVRHARRLNRSGHHREALQAARLSEKLYPVENWEFQIVGAPDSAHHEGIDLANVKIEAGRALGDTAAINEGLRLKERERARYKEWADYRRALPPRLRAVMTSKDLLKARFGQ